MERSARTTTVISSVALAGFLVFVLSSSGAAAGSPAPSAVANEWAYGYVKNVSVGPLIGHDGWVYQGDAVLGYSVILNQTNTSASTFELAVHRTMGAFFSIKFCNPSCAAPTEFAFLTYRVWETTDSFANLTIQGTADQSGVMVPAFALLNAGASLAGNLTESWSSALLGPSGAPSAMVDRTGYLGASVASRSSVAFSPALGLFPTGLGNTPESWSASSAFQANGSANFAYHVATTSSIGPTNVTASRTYGPVVVAPSGNVTLYGGYDPTRTVSFGGASFPALNFTVQGPFDLREGIILVPNVADLFGGESEPWGENQTGDSTVTMSALDIHPGFLGGHVGLVASSWLFSSEALNPADALLSSSGLVPTVTPLPNPVTATSIQGQPQSVPQATTNSNCLTAGTNCPSSPVTSNLGGILRSAIALGAVTVIIATVVGVLVAERRRLPPPAYPNANLYPVGPTGARTPLGSPGSPPSPPSEEDPLDHLW